MTKEYSLLFTAPSNVAFLPKSTRALLPLDLSLPAKQHPYSGLHFRTTAAAFTHNGTIVRAISVRYLVNELESRSSTNVTARDMRVVIGRTNGNAAKTWRFTGIHPETFSQPSVEW